MAITFMSLGVAVTRKIDMVAENRKQLRLSLHSSQINSLRISTFFEHLLLNDVQL